MTLHVVIKGKVQGVFYRATAKDVADEVGVKGWIRNSADGNVEAVVTGNQQQLDEFVRWCKKGSRGSHVEEVIVSPQADEGFGEFEIRH